MRRAFASIRPNRICLPAKELPAMRRLRHTADYSEAERYLVPVPIGWPPEMGTAYTTTLLS